MRLSNKPVRRSLPWLFVGLVLWLGSSQLPAQQTLFSSEHPIRHISVNADGRLHILTDKELCTLEGSRAAAPCHPVAPDARFTVPAEDGTYAVFGQYRFDIFRDGQLAFQDSLPELITAAVLADGQLFIGTAGQGLFRYPMTGGTLRPAGWEGQYINDLAVHGKEILLALDDGVAFFDPKTDNIRLFFLGTIAEKARPLNDTSALVLTADGAFQYIHSVTGKILLSIHPGQPVQALSVSRSEVFFLAGESCYRLSDDLPLETISSGAWRDLLALEHVLLLAEEGRLISLDITTRELPVDGPVLSLFAESEELLWAGTTGRLIQWTRDQISAVIPVPSAIPGLSVTAIYADPRYIYAGTLGDGLFVFDRSGRMVRHVLDESENNKNNILSIRYADGLLWVAYLNGLLTLDPATLALVDDYGGLLGQQYLYSFLPVKRDRFFIGTSGKGLLVFSEGKIGHYLEGSSVLSLAMHGDTLLIGTEEDGLFALHDDRIRPLALVPNIRQLIAIGEEVFVATENGQFILQNDYLIPVPQDGGARGDMQLNAAVATEPYIYAGHGAGILRFHRQRMKALGEIRLDLNVPMLFNRPVGAGERLFRHDEHSFTFSFHTRSYYPGDPLEYHYRLIGLDTSWQRTRENELSYYRLPPGEYRFEVYAGNIGYNMPKNPESYAFEIRPPFWRTGWFAVLAIAALAGLVYILIRLREKNLLAGERRERERIRFEFEQLKNQVDPHFLFNSLNSLIGLIEEDPPAAARAAHQLSALYRNILHYEKVDLVPLDVELGLAAEYFAIHRIRFEDRISLDIRVPAGTPGRVVPLSCQFLIENAIKHNVINAQHPLQITIDVEGDRLVVRNSLRPKDARDAAVSGLDNLKGRYGLLTSRPVEIRRSDDIFEVKIPIVP